MVNSSSSVETDTRFSESSRNSYFNLTLTHCECSALAYFDKQHDVLPKSGTITSLDDMGLLVLNREGSWMPTYHGDQLLKLINMANVDVRRVKVAGDSDSFVGKFAMRAGFTLSISKAQARALFEIVETDGSKASAETLDSLITKGLIVRQCVPCLPQVDLTPPGWIVYSFLKDLQLTGE